MDDTGPPAASCLISLMTRKSQTRTVSSSPALSIMFKLGCQIADLMVAVCPSSSTAGESGRYRSKIRSLFSSPPVTIRVPSGLKSAVRTMCWCENEYNSRPVHASHTLAVKSAEPVTARWAPRVSRALHTAPLWPLNVPIQSPVWPSLSIGLPSDSKHDPV